MKFSPEQLRNIPYLDIENLGGRPIMLNSFFDEGEWHMWVPTPNNGLVKMKGGEPVEAGYFSREGISENDIYLEFLNFMYQRANFSNSVKFVFAILNDIYNLSASLAKLQHTYDFFGDDISVSKFAETEVEYIFTTCRSIFDLLQEVIASIWDNVSLIDNNFEKRELKKTFGPMVLNGNEVKSVEEIIQTRFVPEEIAKFYHAQGSFFKMLRRYRNDIVHRGANMELIFVTERGFAIRDNEKPFADFPVWNEEHKLPNNLASLRPIISHVIDKTLEACEEFTKVISKNITFPSDTFPEFKLFIRGHHVQELSKLHRTQEKCLWWDEE